MAKIDVKGTSITVYSDAARITVFTPPEFANRTLAAG